MIPYYIVKRNKLLCYRNYIDAETRIRTLDSRFCNRTAVPQASFHSSLLDVAVSPEPESSPSAPRSERQELPHSSHSPPLIAVVPSRLESCRLFPAASRPSCAHLRTYVAGLAVSVEP